MSANHPPLFYTLLTPVDWTDATALRCPKWASSHHTDAGDKQCWRQYSRTGCESIHTDMIAAAQINLSVSRQIELSSLNSSPRGSLSLKISVTHTRTFLEWVDTTAPCGIRWTQYMCACRTQPQRRYIRDGLCKKKFGQHWHLQNSCICSSGKRLDVGKRTKTNVWRNFLKVHVEPWESPSASIP